MEPERSKARALPALFLIVPAPSVGILVWFWLAPGTTVGFVTYIVAKCWLYGLPVLWLLLVERKPLSWSKPEYGGFGVGIGLGVVISALIGGVFILLKPHIDTAPIRELVEKNGLDDPLRYIGAGLYIATINAVLEEYVFRWFIFRQCERLIAGFPAVLLAAFFFTIHHVIVLKAYFDWPLTILASLGVFIGGAAWSWCYLRYRSIWPGYVSHAIVDIAVLAIGWILIFEMW